jgi:hypothetical protein
MTKYIETKIVEIKDTDFQTLIAELCESVRMRDEGIKNMTLVNLFSTFVTGKKVMNLQQLPTEKILSKKSEGTGIRFCGSWRVSRIGIGKRKAYG